jgi:hypothetical protein
MTARDPTPHPAPEPAPPQRVDVFAAFAKIPGDAFIAQGRFD